MHITFFGRFCVAFVALIYLNSLDLLAGGGASRLAPAPIKLSGQLKQVLRHDSNITQLPDGQVSVTDRSGGHASTQLTAKFQAVSKDKKKQPELQLSLGQSRYFDGQFASRNSQNVSLGLQVPFEPSKTSKWMAFSAKFSQRFDFLYAFGPKSLAFHTSTLGGLGILKPKKVKHKHVDLWVPVLGLDLEYRNFIGGYERDALGEKKDSFTPSLLLMALGMKTYKNRMKGRTTLMLNVRPSMSDVANEQYTSLRASVAWAAQWERWELSPNLTWVGRRQDNYSGQSRRDDRWDVGVDLSYTVKKGKLGLSFKHSEQGSNLNAFSYDNDQLGLSAALTF